MGRYSNYPKTVEDCLIFRVKSLTENGNSYLKNYGTSTGVTTWYTNNEKTASISIEVTHKENQSFIILSYNFNDEPMRYKVNLISKVSNLGKGKIWYFVCPETHKLCRKLYQNGGYFLHRTAFKNLMYAKQLESKKYRDLGKIFHRVFLPDKVYTELYSKYFKTHYNGKPTKRYLKIKQKIDIANSFEPNTLKNLVRI